MGVYVIYDKDGHYYSRPDNFPVFCTSIDLAFKFKNSEDASIKAVQLKLKEFKLIPIK